MLGDTSSVDNAKFTLAGSDEEYPARQIQMLEKEFLGFYVTSHPLATIRDKLPFLMTHKISEIANIENDKTVTICGLVTSMNQKQYKNDPGKYLRFLTVEDLTGKIECLAFHEKVLNFGDFLQAEQRIIVSGKVSRKDDNQLPTILIDTVKPVDNSNIFTIELKQDVNYEDLVSIKDLLCKSSGSDPVMFKVKDLEGETKVLTSSMFWVNCTNDLVHAVENNFGDKVGVSIKSIDADVKADI